MSTTDTLSSETVPSADAGAAVKVSRPERSVIAIVRSSPPGLTVARSTDTGRVRERNEDAFVVVECSARGETGQTDLALLVIADGMGGHDRGEVASLLAAQVAAASVTQDVFLPFLSRQPRDGQRRPLNEALVEAVRAANAVVLRDVPAGGSTLTVALVFGPRVYLAHVGDCRAYVCDERGLRRITQDHSLVARLVQTGHVTTAEAHTHSHRNVLYRAVGQAETLEVDTYMEPLAAGACLLLCSDGLWDSVGDADIARILHEAPDARTAVDRLVAAANERGGGDNITVLIAVQNSDV
jgi:protein phosphatase